MERISLAVLKMVTDAAPTFATRMLVENTILRSAFSLVENREDPKGPINACINPDSCDFEPDVLKYAVEYFTATSATIDQGVRHFWIRSAGYRAGPAGDH
jgi:hypothetical protein